MIDCRKLWWFAGNIPTLKFAFQFYFFLKSDVNLNVLPEKMCYLCILELIRKYKLKKGCTLFPTIRDLVSHFPEFFHYSILFYSYSSYKTIRSGWKYNSQIFIDKLYICFICMEIKCLVFCPRNCMKIKNKFTKHYLFYSIM